MLAAVLALGGCDRIAEQWPKQPASSVTVKLPPAKTVAPGFAFQDERKGPAAPLR